MAESTLSPSILDIRLEVQRYLGWGRAVLSSGDAKSDVDAILKRGLRQFYAPVVLPGDTTSHEWSFMQPTATLEIKGAFASGTVQIANGVVTLTGSTWPTYAAQHGNVFSIGGVEYTVASRGSGTEITLSDTSSAADSAAGSTYSLTFPKYAMPDSFGGIVGPLTYSLSSGEREVQVVSENYIRDLRQMNSQTNDAPQYAAIRPRNDYNQVVVKTGDPSNSSRYESMFWPAPDADYTLTYAYNFLIDELIDNNGNYPPGGSLHGETIMASCLAVAELYAPEESSRYRQDYLLRLAASVTLDRKANAPEYFGYNADRSDGQVFVRKQLTRATYTDKLGNVYPS